MLKKLVCIVIIMVLSLSVFACNNNDGDKETSLTVAEFDLPNYDLTKKIISFADFPPMPTDGNLNLFKSCGFNTVFLDLNQVEHKTVLGEESDYFKKIKTLDQMGFDVLIHSASSFYDGVDFSNYPNVIGFVVTDEPPKSVFENIYNNSVTWMNNGKEDYLFYINLFPSGAGSSLGVYPSGGKSAYENYIDAYFEDVLSKVEGKKQIGLDHYALRQRSGELFLSDLFLYDLMTVAQKAKEEKVDKFSACVQSFGDGGDLRNIRASEEISFQLYTYLAFGVSIFEFFPYMSTLDYYAMFKNGERTETWYAVQKALTEINLFDEVYMNFTWNGLATFVGKNNPSNYDTSHFDYISKKVKKLDGVKKVSSSQDTIIGEFSDGFGNNAYMIVNYTDPLDYKFDTVDLEFDNVKKVAVYKNGVCTKYNIEKNKLSLPLIPGEGVFVITFED